MRSLGAGRRRSMYVRVVAILTVLSAASLDAAGGKQNSSPSPAQEIPHFRVATDGVRLDAVVTDHDGRVVPDLTAEDFEVRQDGKIQKLLFAQFVPVLSGRPGRSAISAATNHPDSTPPDQPQGTIRREEVQRTLAIVVDDLSLSAESYPDAKRALHAFVDRELRPTDLVALVRTGGSIGALQPFSLNRRLL